MAAGVIGLGIMGKQCCRKLMESGIPVCGCDCNAQAAEQAAAEGIRTYASPADLAQAADAVILFVPGPAECQAVCLGPAGIAASGHEGLIVINMSTVPPETNISLAAKLAEKNMVLVDAPVLGDPVNVGRWSLILGGSDEAYVRVREILVALAGNEGNIFRAGAVGNGNKAKLLNNMMLGAINGCAAEIMALAKHIGISQQLLYEAAAAANARTLSSAYRDVAEKIAEGSYDQPTFSLELLKKDNMLCLEMANKAGAPCVIGNAIDYVNRRAVAQGYGKLDYTAAWLSVYDSWHKNTDHAVFPVADPFAGEPWA